MKKRALCTALIILIVSSGCTSGHLITSGAIPNVPDGLKERFSVNPQTGIVFTWDNFATTGFNLLGTGNEYSANIGISESGYTGSFKLSGCSGVAQTPSTVTTGFRIVGIAPGSCTLEAQDSHAVKGSFAVTVTTTEVIVTSVPADAKSLTAGGASASAAAPTTRIPNAGVGNSTATWPITIFAYDKPLTSGGRPQGARLAAASGSVNIVGSKANTVTMAIGGIPHFAQITALNAGPSATGVTQNLGLKLKISDFDGNEITAPVPYADVTGAQDPVTLLAQGAPYASATVFVNGNGQINTLTSPHDSYALHYSGSGMAEGTLKVFQDGVVLASATISPIPTFTGYASTPPLPANASVVAFLPNEIWFTEPGRHAIATLRNGVTTEFKLPSGHTPTLVGTFQNIADEVCYATAEGTIGMASPSGITEYTLPSKGAVVSALALDTAAYACSFTEATRNLGVFNGDQVQEHQVKGASQLTSISGEYFSDAGTNSLGTWNQSTGAITELPLPATGGEPNALWINYAQGSGTPTQFWIALSGTPAFLRYSTGQGFTKIPSMGEITSWSSPNNLYVFGTDTAGNIEGFDTTTFAERTIKLGTHGPAYHLVPITNGDTRLLYICPTCSNGVQEMIY